jgi:hypothetical protein
MGTVHLNEPALDPADRPCFICLSVAKQFQWELYADLIEEGLKAPAKETAWIPWPSNAPPIRPGNWRGICGDAPQVGVTDGLCWDHLAGIGVPKPPSPLVDGSAIPPGLLKGKG